MDNEEKQLEEIKEYFADDPSGLKRSALNQHFNNHSYLTKVHIRLHDLLLRAKGEDIAEIKSLISIVEKRLTNQEHRGERKTDNQ